MDGGATKTVTDQTTGAEPNYVFGGYKETYGLYEDGKHRRYGLLFSVNGGGFTVGSLFAKAENAPLLGNLTVSQLAIGMAIFTVAMYADILTFGMRFRHIGHDDGKGWYKGIFSKVGGLVLTIICGVIVAGWMLVVRWS
jgi:hypothetical protein